MREQISHDPRIIRSRVEDFGIAKNLTREVYHGREYGDQIVTVTDEQGNTHTFSDPYRLEANGADLAVHLIDEIVEIAGYTSIEVGSSDHPLLSKIQS